MSVPREYKQAPREPAGRLRARRFYLKSGGAMKKDWVILSALALTPATLLACAFLLSGRARIESDVGIVSFPNSGAAAAQEVFLHGLAQLHNFEYDDAAEDFQRAEQIDPGFAMAYWGEAMTKNHPIWMEQDLAAARAILKRLGETPETRLAKAGTEREKDYLRALEILYGEGSKEERDLRYADAMGALHEKYPDDPEATSFYALALLGTSHRGRDIPTYMRAAALLEDIFYAYPQHPGAAHYLIHSFDDPVHAPLGLRAAQAYSKIAPNAAHAQHMTSHIFVAMGMWDAVVKANETAVAVVDRARRKKGLPPSACGHVNYWLEYGYLQQGRPEDAKRLLEECRAAAGRFASAHHEGMIMKMDPDASFLGSFAVMWLRYLLDTGEWRSEVATWQISAEIHLGARITLAFGEGFAGGKRSELDRAREALSRLESARREVEAFLAKQGEPGLAYRGRGEILEWQLRAVILAAEGKNEEALELVRRAVEAEASMPFEFGPPFIDKPSQELLGEMLLSLKRPAEARQAFEASLARAPERTASLAGLLRAARAQGDGETARRVQSKLRGIWHQASRVPDGVL